MQKNVAKKKRIFPILFKIFSSVIYVGLIVFLCVQALMPASVSGDFSNALGNQIDNLVTDLQGGQAQTVNVTGVEISSLIIGSDNHTEETVTVDVGSSGTLSCHVSPADATNPALSYSSNAPQIVSVETDGKLKALTVGTAVITVTSKENSQFKDTITIVVQDIAITALQVDNLPTELRVGDLHRLEVACTPSNTTQKSVVWSSSDKSVLTVDASGTLSALAEGTAQITATSTANSAVSHTVTVSVLPVPVITPVEEINLQVSETIGYIGKTAQITATLSPAEAEDKILWETSNSKIATVSQTGLVKYLKAGTVTITAKCSKYDVQSSITLTVKEVLSKTIKLSVKNATKTADNEYTMDAGQTGKVTATLDSNATIHTVEYESSDPSVASISSDGTILTRAEGEVTITAKTSYDGKTTSASFTLKVNHAVVLPTVSVESVQITNTTLGSRPIVDKNVSVYIGATDNLSCKVLPVNATNPALSYSSNKPKIVKVSASGKIEALALGTAVITVTSQDNSNLKDTITITVQDIPVESVQITSLPTKLRVGESHRLEVKYTPNNTSQNSVVWSSSDTSVLTVDTSGTLTAIATGTATITAQSTINEAVLHTVEITVYPEFDVVESISLTAKSNVGYIGNTLQITASLLPSTTTDTVIWDTSNSKIATVSQSGLVKCLKAGTVTITASCSKYDVSKSITLTVKEVLSKNIDLTLKNFTNLSDDTYSLKIGTSGKVTTTLDKKATVLKVTFTSSDNSIAEVNADGAVKAVKKGTVTITASTSYDGETTSASFTLNVEPLSFSETMENFYLWIRKSFGHFGAFMALGIFATLTYFSFFPKSTKGKIVAFIVCMLAGAAVAVITEIFQLPIFTVGRHCSVDDMLLDFTGYCSSAIVMWLCIFAVHIIIKIKNMRKKKQ